VGPRGFTCLRSTEPLSRGGPVKVPETREVEEAPGLQEELQCSRWRPRVGDDAARSGSARARGSMGEGTWFLEMASSSRRAAWRKGPRPMQGRSSRCSPSRRSFVWVTKGARVVGVRGTAGQKLATSFDGARRGRSLRRRAPLRSSER